MGQCITDCYPGFYSSIVNGSVKCEMCHSSCERCKGAGVDNCTVCKDGSQVVSNGVCVEKRNCSVSEFYS